MEVLTSIIEGLGSAQGFLATAGGGVALKVILRLVPTKSPMGVIIAVRAVTGLIEKIFDALNDLLDSIIPQKTK